MNKTIKYIITALVIFLIGLLGWYFRTILIYLALSCLVALIGRPLVEQMIKIRIKKFKFPSWLASILTIIVILALFLSIFVLVAPLFTEISEKLSVIDINKLSNSVSGPLATTNGWIINIFPDLGDNFKIEVYLLSQVRDMFSVSTFSSIINSITSILIDFLVGLFSVIFISFFLLQEKKLLTRLIQAILPEKYETKVEKASSSTKFLLSRYFIGIFIESMCIAILDSLGLIFIAGMHSTLAIVVGTLCGIINIIPYLGPIIGHVIAATMGLITYIGSGMSVSLGLFIILILVVTIGVQLLDNYIFQPIIYSRSVKAHPLEIFIVVLVAGHMGGVGGMIVAIPIYTVLRVIVAEFFSDSKFAQRVSGNSVYLNKKSDKSDNLDESND
ncbi:MAG: AI-2E family transporter [Bacteroidales bacterium]